MIIWADSDEEQSGLHTSFKLSASGESLILSDSEGTVLDEVTFIDQETDISYGRFPNGIGDFQFMEPSFNALNSNTTSTIDSYINSVSVFPNPSNHRFEIVSKDNTYQDVEGIVYNKDGKIMCKFIIDQKVNINASEWPSGIYILRTKSTSTKLIKL